MAERAGLLATPNSPFRGMARTAPAGFGWDRWRLDGNYRATFCSAGKPFDTFPRFKWSQAKTIGEGMERLRQATGGRLPAAYAAQETWTRLSRHRAIGWRLPAGGVHKRERGVRHERTRP